jgi:FKBP-type peptidyl-prolyl cis-trans isomerase FkpA
MKKPLLFALLGGGLVLAAASPSLFAKPKAPKGDKASALTCKARLASGLGVDIIKPGKGAKPDLRDTVRVNYAGFLASNGKPFDKGNGIEFPLDRVIPGFSEGLAQLAPGGKARLCIPAKMGYAARATGGIPANSDLIFDVDLVSITPAPVASVLPPEERVCAQKTASGLGYTVLNEGKGERPTDQHIALINYVGSLASDGTTFDANKNIAMPVGGAVPGFTEGLKLMPVGSSYRLCIPPELGYGAEGTGPIPGGATMIFKVDLIDAKLMSADNLKMMQRQTVK